MANRVSLVPQGILTPAVQVGKPKIAVNCNNDQVIITWKYNKPIQDCIGFAVYRKLNNETDAEADALVNRVGFAGEPFTKGEQRPSYEWPIQRFIWTDFSVSEGDSACYKIVPILYDGEKLIKDDKNISAWSAVVQLKTGVDENGAASPYHVYFNRGIISSQFFSKMKHDLAAELPGSSVKSIIGGSNNKLRDFLGGFLDNRLFAILDEVVDDPTLSIYTALYELHQPDLIDKLKKISSRAHVILANGAAKKKDEDKNDDSRKMLKDSGVDVYDRIVDVTKKHFAHNKFVVICKNGVPKRVWSGSTNWTPGGVFAQVNNGILISIPELAAIYLDEWKALQVDVKEDLNNYGVKLYNHNKAAKPFAAGKNRVWFAPTHDFSDLKDVEDLMEKAKEGILFLMFNPGPKNTFFNYILDLQTRKPGLFIHGVINQDPGASSHADLILFHNGQQVETDWNSIMPETISEDFSFWYKEVSAGLVTIHSKILVIDPFGEKPIVVTGSHNFGPKASSTNDENLLIINDKKVAEQYTVNIMAVYDHFRWRYSLFHKNTDFKGLTRDREWMSDYMQDKNRAKELDFWL